jgi:hypothetical protein
MTVRVRVCGGAAHVAPESLSLVLHDLEVSYIGYIINACVEA